MPPRSTQTLTPTLSTWRVSRRFSLNGLTNLSDANVKIVPAKRLDHKHSSVDAQQNKDGADGEENRVDNEQGWAAGYRILVVGTRPRGKHLKWRKNHPGDDHVDGRVEVVNSRSRRKSKDMPPF